MQETNEVIEMSSSSFEVPIVLWQAQCSRKARHVYKYAWVQNGDFLLRKMEASGITKVKCEADVGKLERCITNS